MVQPTPASDPGGWVTPDDYPPQALANNVHGLVGFRLDIDSAGRVDSCTVTQSSGSVDLDQAACQLIVARARFKPGTSKGQAVPSHYNSRVNWVIPQKPVLQPGMVRMTYVVAPDGTPSDCQWYAEGSALPELAKAKQHVCPATMGFSEGYTDTQGRPVARKVVVTNRVDVLPLEETPAAPQKPAG